MATKRTYGDGCGIAHALDLVGERWALLVVRELVLGPKRFTDLTEALPKVTPSVLAQRLRELEEIGVLRRDTLPPPAASQVYELTPWGSRLEAVLIALGEWGASSPTLPDDLPVGPDSAMLAMKTLFSPPDMAVELEVELVLGDLPYAVRVVGGELQVARGRPASPAASLRTTSDGLESLMWRRETLDEALASGAAALEGDRSAVEELLGQIEVPAPV